MSTAREFNFLSFERPSHLYPTSIRDPPTVRSVVSGAVFTLTRRSVV